MDRKNQTLYLECESGISGDMTAAALLDLGADQEGLMRMLRSLPVSGFEVKIGRVEKSGLDMCDFDVVMDAEHENHDHDMNYLHGHENAREDPMAYLYAHDSGHADPINYLHGHENAREDPITYLHGHEYDHEHSHEHGHSHDHDHSHDHGHSHEHRGLEEIFSVIDGADMTENAKEIAKRIFDILADAESEAHGVPKEQVHFHEVGAVDSIVDILSVAYCLDDLGIRQVIVPCLKEGVGSIRCQHGILPVPVPATLNIVVAHHLPIRITKTRGELVTPTGAAIVAAVCTSFELPETFMVERMGMGAGKRNYERPSMLRAMLIHSETEETERIYKLETNIDDCTGENLGYCLERLMKAGARDAHYIPVYMKKNRPAYQLNVICTKEEIPRMERIIFEETTTIGIRRVPMERTVLKRELRTVRTPLGEGVVKICRYGESVQVFPEYNSVVQLCQDSGCHYREAYEELLRACLDPEGL